MKEIIGVYHSGPKVRDAVIDYLTTNHPTLDSIMLELPENWQDPFVQHHFQDYFFDTIGQKYSKKGANVIPGDRLQWELYGGFEKVARRKISIQECFSEERFVKMLYKQIINTFIDQLKFVGESIIRTPLYDRNIDMAIVAMEQNPDIILLGDLHASFLHKLFPEVKYTVITSKYLPTRLIPINKPNQIIRI